MSRNRVVMLLVAVILAVAGVALGKTVLFPQTGKLLFGVGNIPLGIFDSSGKEVYRWPGQSKLIDPKPTSISLPAGDYDFVVSWQTPDRCPDGEKVTIVAGKTLDFPFWPISQSGPADPTRGTYVPPKCYPSP